MYSVVRNVDCITAYMHACASHYIYCACNTIKKHVYAKKIILLIMSHEFH